MERIHKSALKGLNDSLQDVEKLLQQKVEQEANVFKNYTLIRSVPVIGHLTAIYLISSTNNFSARPSGKQLASYPGVVPFEHSSGISIKGKNRVHKMANKELKKMLHLCAMVCVGRNDEFRDYFNRKKNEGKHGLSIINAIKNKLCLRVVAVINKQQPYENNVCVRGTHIDIAKKSVLLFWLIIRKQLVNAVYRPGWQYF